MGAYWSYVNWDLKEYFSIGIGGFDVRLDALSHTPAARAFGLLLARPSSHRLDTSHHTSIAGRWSRSRVSVEPDDDNPEWWGPIVDSFTDVTADAIVMLCLFEPAEKIAEYCIDDHFFSEVAHLVVTYRLPTDLRQALEAHLGGGYRERYATLAASWSVMPSTDRLPPKS